MAGKKAKRAGRPAKKATGLDRKISAKTAQSKKTTRHPSGAPKKNTQLRRTHSTVVAKRGATTKPTSKPDGKDASYGIRPSSKLGIIVTMLQQKDGSTIAEMARATGWQKHSVHGAISGTLRTKMGLTVTTELRDSVHHYRLVG